MTATFLPTLHTYTTRGRVAVRRIIIDGGTRMWFEISCIRRAEQQGATFQGSINLEDGRWIVEVAKAGGRVEKLADTFDDYIDAEDALLRIRTGVMSDYPWFGPRPRRCEAYDWCGHVWIGEAGSRCSKHRYCRKCGWPLYDDGDCTRPDLHWTPAKIAAQNARRAAREAARAEALTNDLTLLDRKA
jgi:hypothetical protein